MFWLLLNSACTASRSFLSPILHPQRVGWVGARGWEGTQAGPKIKQRAFPSYVMTLSTIRDQGKERNGVHLWLCFCPQLSLDNCLPTGRGEKCLSFFFLLCSSGHLLLHFVLIHDSSCLLSLFSTCHSRVEQASSQPVPSLSLSREMDLL